MRIKIYGERNTGTNYLERLIAFNLEARLLRTNEPRWLYLSARILRSVPRFLGGPRAMEAIKDLYFKYTTTTNLGWKHALVSAELLGMIQRYPHDVLILVVTKNPYAFLLSLFKRPYQYLPYAGAFDQFLLKSWPPAGRDSPSGFANPIAMWNEKNRAYFELERRIPTVILRFEDLVLDPEETIERISARHNIKRRRQRFQNVETSTKKDQGKDFAYYQKYYLEEQWKAKLTNRNIEIINSCLDRSIMERLGYEEITPEVGQTATSQADSLTSSGT